MAEDFGGKPFSLVHYLSIQSAIGVNRPDKVYFHYEFEPEGPWWEKIKPQLTLNQLEAPREIFGRPLAHVAHRADVVRLQMLQSLGGIYLDLDTISVRPLSPLLGHDFVIGQELKAEHAPRNWRQRLKKNLSGAFSPKNKTPEVGGLCNAVLLSKPDSDFVNLWLEEYRNFRSLGRDKYWNEHSVFVPMQLAAAHPNKITLADPYAFHYPLYNREGLKAMFEDVVEFPGAYLHHLWESFAWEPYMKNLSPESILHHPTTYNLLARPYLD